MRQATSNYSTSVPYLEVLSTPYLEILPRFTRIGASCPTKLDTLTSGCHPHSHSDSQNSICCSCLRELHQYSNDFTDVGAWKSVDNTGSLCHLCMLQQEGEKGEDEKVVEEEEREQKEPKEREKEQQCKDQESVLELPHKLELKGVQDIKLANMNYYTGCSRKERCHPVLRTHTKSVRTDSNDSGIRMCLPSNCDGEVGSLSEYDDSGGVFVSSV